MNFRAKLHVMLKKDVADVQGNAIRQALERHGDQVADVKVGKYFEVELEAASEQDARAMLERLAQGTFSNPVIEQYWYEIAPVG